MMDIFGTNDQSELSEEYVQLLITLTKKMLEGIRKETQSASFWNNVGSQRKLKTLILGQLLTISVKKIKSKKNY